MEVQSWYPTMLAVFKLSNQAENNKMVKVVETTILLLNWGANIYQVQAEMCSKTIFLLTRQKNITHQCELILQFSELFLCSFQVYNIDFYFQCLFLLKHWNKRKKKPVVLINMKNMC